MADVSTDASGAGDGGEDPMPDNALFDLYRDYIGEPDAETDVYLGFGLFVGGIVMLGVALAIFLWAGQYEFRSDPYFQFAGPAYAIGMLAIPLTLTSIVVLLPVKTRALVASLGGVAVTVGAVAWFLVLYPYSWNVQGADATILVVGLYAVGLAGVVASNAAALIAHQIERHKPTVAPHEIEGVESTEPEPGDEEYYSEEEIRADIEEAMAETEISWGGVEKSENRQLKLNTETVDSNQVSGLEIDPDVKRESGGVDAQVEGLRKMKGGDKKTARAENSTVDDQTAALNELKQQKRQGEVPEDAPAEDDEGLVDRFKGMFS